jgi:hypothetical protein
MVVLVYDTTFVVKLVPGRNILLKLGFNLVNKLCHAKERKGWLRGRKSIASLEIVDNSVNAIFQMVFTEINEQSQSTIRKSKIGQQDFEEDRCKRLN